MGFLDGGTAIIRRKRLAIRSPWMIGARLDRLVIQQQ
jgi:hypothetical protein